MKISRSNYEIFFLDYHEGRLSMEETEVLFKFLEMNPDLKVEFFGFENIHIVEDNEKVYFPEKDKLRKEEVVPVGNFREDNYQELFIAHFEGDLSESGAHELQLFISANPKLEKEFELFSSLKITPDLDVIYPEKSGLKQKVFVMPATRVVLKYAASLAAVLVFGLVMYNFLFNILNNQNSKILYSDNRADLPEFQQGNRILQPDNQYSAEVLLLIERENSTREPEGSVIEYIPAGKAGSIAGYINLRDIFPETASRQEFAEIYSLQNEKFKLTRREEYSLSINNTERIFDKVIDNIRGNAENAEEQLSKINGWQLAEYGVKGFNLLTDNNIDFSVKSNEQGEVTKFALNNFAVPVKTNR